MNAHQSWNDDDQEPIDLKDLLAPTARQILDGNVYKSADYSVFHLAREALGWQSWARENDVPLAGNPMVMTQQAARSLGVSVSAANAAFTQADAQGCIPAAKFKGGDEACWMKIAELDLEIYKACCPEDLRPEVERRIDDYRSNNSKPAEQLQKNKPAAEKKIDDAPFADSAVTGSRQAAAGANYSDDREPDSTQAESNAASTRPIRSTEIPDDVPGIKIELEQPASEIPQPQQRMNQDFAVLGRQIVDMAGHEKDGKLAFEGKVNYKIVVNLDSNTMKIYSKDRGGEPILVDANGNIDHENSRVLLKDVEKFRAALNFLQQDHERKVADYQR